MSIATGTRVAMTFVGLDARVVGLNAAAQTLTLCDRTWEFTFADGTGASQVQKVYAASRTLPGSTEDLDLSGVLTDLFGSTISATEVKAWGVYNSSDASLTVGATGGNNWTTCLNGSVTLPAGSACQFATRDATGWTVTAGTGDLLRLAGTTGKGYEVFFFLN